jgi:F-type H+-transporting ATPase subunit gamma
MANLKEIRKRIQSVKNTQQITSAMKMVAAARLKKSQERIEKARPYAVKMADVLASLAMRTYHKAHPLLTRREVERVAIVVVTSDRGLCGAFNQNIIKTTEQFIRQHRSRYAEMVFILIGKKGFDYFKIRPITIQREYTGVSGKVNYELAQTIAGSMRELFLTDKVDEIYILYNRFKSTISQEVVFDRLIPITPAEVPAENVVPGYVFEPSDEEVLDEIINKNLETQVFRALLESEASELGARMTAMDSATSNAEEMIKKLTLKYNRARQETITKELMEIISGAEALG